MASALTAPTSLGSVSASSASNPFSLTLADDVPTGYSVVVFVAIASTTITISAFTDNKGNVYTPLAISPFNSGSRRCWIYVCPATTAPLQKNVDVISITFSSTTGYRLIAAFKFYGGKETSYIDVVPAAATGTSATPSTPSSGVLAQSEEILFGVVLSDSPQTDNLTGIGGGFTALTPVQIGTSGSFTSIFPAYKIVSVTTASTYSGTLPASRVWAAAIFSYLAGPQPETLRTATVLIESDQAGGDPVMALSSVVAEVDRAGGLGPLSLSSLIAEADKRDIDVKIAELHGELDFVGLNRSFDLVIAEVAYTPPKGGQPTPQIIA